MLNGRLTLKTTFCHERFGLSRIMLVRSIGLFLLGLVVAGCSGGKQTSDTVAGGKIVIKGSNTIGEELAPRLIAEYKKEHPGVVVELESKGTGSGFTALLAGESDIAAASRVVSQDELRQAQSRGIEFNVHTIGSYGVAVIVNGGSPIGNLTRDQVRDIFTGVVRNWKEVGGADSPIHLYIRDPISGTYLGFRELAMEDKPYAAKTTAFTNYDGIIHAVAQDTNAIGYASIALAQKGGVKAVAIRGIIPGELSINEGQYPFSRVLRLYTNKSKVPTPALDFIRFVQSTRGQEILDQLGFVRRL
jgi:phosphate transport system substrate-binding protein